jgi:signal transduction histidine kinase
VAQTPSGLKVAINLTDKQVIPASGYTITITPLNGAGSSFQQADIYIDGVKVASITPGSDGTARWQWDPSAQPGTHVEIRVVDTAGTVTTFTFDVTIGRAVPATSQATGTSNGGGASELAPGKPFIVSRFFKQATESAKRVIKQLPAPVVYTFPYMLFILLLVEIMVLLLQTKREVREQQTTKQLAAQERTIADMKQTFTELVSHYLRTPLTVLQGGVEGLIRDGVPSASVSALQDTARQLHATVESLIPQTSTGGGMVITAEAAVGKPKTGLRKLQAGQIAIWLPVALVGVLVFCFVYLANQVSRFTTNAIGIFTQVLVYSILILVLYQVMRRWQLHRHDTRSEQKILAEEQAVQTMRDGVIVAAADRLRAQVATLGTLAKDIPPTAANAKFVTRGYTQLNTVANKFIIASRLKGARSPEAYQSTSVQALYGQIEGGLKQLLADKQVEVVLPSTDPVLSVQNPSLLALVLQTLLDNAIAYSQPGRKVELSIDTTLPQTVMTVTDHGAGISADKQAALFQPFFKVEGAETFNREGMGFSLYLDKLIMTYLGGSLELTSEPGVSTRVALRW